MNVREFRRRNLRRLIDSYINDEVYDKQEDFAEAVGIDKSYLSQMLMHPDSKGARGVSETKARQIERILGLVSGILDKPDSSTPISKIATIENGILRPIPSAILGSESKGLSNIDYSYFVLVPQFDVRGACGLGYSNELEHLKGGLVFREDWIRSKGLSPRHGNSAIITAEGHSMSPTIQSGNVLLINLMVNSFIEVVSGHIYAFIANNELRIKRIFREITTGGIRIASDNTDKTIYPDEYLQPNQIDQIKIVGCVVWRGGDI